EKLLKKHRQRVHIAMSLIVIFVIIIFEVINDQAIIHQLFTFAGYTYGPLLGFYSFGLFTKYKVYDRLVPVVAVASPVLSYGTKLLLEQGIENYKVGFELLLINGFITIIGLFILRMRN
ncbi:MAG: sodium:solute symporter, partial [bacterium]